MSFGQVANHWCFDHNLQPKSQNSEIWHLPSLKQTLKQKILSSSARALKLCMKFDTSMYSFERIHSINKRATPEKFMIYKHAIQLFKLYNDGCNSLEWQFLNFNQVLTSRQTLFHSIKANLKRVGLNALANRLFILNNKIPLEWLNLSYNSFKIKCKESLL